WVDLEVQIATGVAVAGRRDVLATALRGGGGTILVRLVVHLFEALRDGARAGEVDRDGPCPGGAGEAQNQAESDARRQPRQPLHPVIPSLRCAWAGRAGARHSRDGRAAWPAAPVFRFLQPLLLRTPISSSGDERPTFPLPAPRPPSRRTGTADE